MRIALQEEGYALLSNCLEPGLLEQLQRDLEGRFQGAGDREAWKRRRSLEKALSARFWVPANVVSPGSSFLRCIVFDKTAETNWKVGWHQDLNIKCSDGAVLPWRDLSRVVTLRLHLDPTGADNGALRVMPGSHRLGVLNDEEKRGLSLSEKVVEADPGDVLIMSPLLLHASSASVCPARRRVIHADFLEEESA